MKGSGLFSLKRLFSFTSLCELAIGAKEVKKKQKKTPSVDVKGISYRLRAFVCLLMYCEIEEKRCDFLSSTIEENNECSSRVCCTKADVVMPQRHNRRNLSLRWPLLRFHFTPGSNLRHCFLMTTLSIFNITKKDVYSNQTRYSMSQTFIVSQHSPIRDSVLSYVISIAERSATLTFRQNQLPLFLIKILPISLYAPVQVLVTSLMLARLAS
jgi:hypothetical protein